MDVADTGNMYLEMDEETRNRLALFLGDKNEMLKAKIEINERKIAVLQNPTTEAVEDLREFSAIVLGPIRNDVSEQSIELLQEAIDVEQLRAMLPMILMAATSSINIPLLLTVVDVDPDMIQDFVSKMKEYFSKDLA